MFEKLYFASSAYYLKGDASSSLFLTLWQEIKETHFDLLIEYVILVFLSEAFFSIDFFTRSHLYRTIFEQLY